jgi:hypothetical protein
VTDYVEGLEGPAAIELADMIASASADAGAEDAADRTSSGFVYSEEHKSQQQLQAGLKAGIYCQGKLTISNHNLFEVMLFQQRAITVMLIMKYQMAGIDIRID